MVRTLSEIALQSIAFEFSRVALLIEKHSLLIPPSLKIELLRRLVDHDLLSTNILPSITYNLIPQALTELDFYGSLSLSDSLLALIGESGCQLRRIRLSRCSRISDAGLSDLMVNQDALESVSLKYLLIEGKCLERLRSPKLLELCVIGCANVAPEPLTKVVVCNSSSLVKLNLKQLRKLPSNMLIKIIDFAGPNLRYLNLSECVQVNDAVLFRIAERCEKLETLKVRECMNFFELSLVHVFEQCSNLSKLDISFCVREEVAGLIEVLPRSLKTFRYYGFTTSLSNDAMVNSFSQLKCLNTLALNGLNTLSDDLLQQLLVVIGPQLESLDLSASFGRISDAGVKWIVRYCVNLRKLGLGMLESLSGLPLLELLEDPERAEKMESFNLPCCTGMNESVLTAICSNCPNLVFLDLSAIPHTTDALLFELANTANRLEQLFVKSSRCITDAGVCVLAAGCPWLKGIVLSGITNISDKSLMALASHCPLLEGVYLSGCMIVSDQAIQYLKDSCSRRVTCYHIVSSSHASDLSVVVAKNLDTGEYVRLSN